MVDKKKPTKDPGVVSMAHRKAFRNVLTYSKQALLLDHIIRLFEEMHVETEADDGPFYGDLKQRIEALVTGELNDLRTLILTLTSREFAGLGIGPVPDLPREFVFLEAST